MNDPNPQALAAIPGRYAQPDPATLATLPKGGANLSYMGHAEVTLALIDVDPLWEWEPVTFDEVTGAPKVENCGKWYVMWGYLTVCGHRRLCVGTCEAHKAEYQKELLGDALRNGAMRFGIGTKLWSKAHASPAPRAKAPAPRPSEPVPDSNGITPKQLQAMVIAMGGYGIHDRAARLTYVAGIVGREVGSSKELTKAEAGKVLDALTAMSGTVVILTNDATPEPQPIHDDALALMS